MRWSSTWRSKELLLLRWTFTLLSLGCAVFTAQELAKHHHDFEPCFEPFYYVVNLLLTCSACACAWLKRTRGLVLFGVASQTVNAFGTLYVLMILAFYPSFILREHAGVVAWDLAVFGFAVFMVVYLSQRYLTVRNPDASP